MSPSSAFTQPPSTWTADTYLAAVKVATSAAAAYYNTDQLEMDDATYDALVRDIAFVEKRHPEWKTSNGIVDTVAAGTGQGDITHSAPMLSLENVFDDTEMVSWVAGVEARLGEKVPLFTVEPKLDGLALVARYVDGALTLLLTRGDGEAGEDVTFAAPHIQGLPTKLKREVTIEVRGEVLLTDKQFQAANELRVQNGDPVFANPRNGAAGALRGAANREYGIELSFFGYGAVTLDAQLADGHEVEMMPHSELLRLLTDLGVATTASHELGAGQAWSVQEVNKLIDELYQSRGALGLAIDGAVVKVDDPVLRNRLGFNARAPRWGVARKFPPDMGLSVLEDVVWQVGRTGLLTPRAQIRPVVVDGTEITYATLHNPADIERKGFLLHDTVSVVRAGDVVPRLEAPVVTARTGVEKPIAVPEECPRCGSGIDKSQQRWRCVRGRECGLVELLHYAAGRDCWDIEGLGTRTAQLLVDAGLVHDLGDIFSLTEEQLLTLEGYSTLRARNLMSEIENAKTAPFARTLAALGIRGTGRAMSRRIAVHFPDFTALADATFEQLAAVDGIGEIKADLILREVEELGETISKLRAVGMGLPGVEDEIDAAGELPGQVLAGERVVVTGTMTGVLGSYARTEVTELLESAGAAVTGSVSKRTTLLVCGDNAGSKLRRAQELGVAIISPEQLAQKLGL